MTTETKCRCIEMLLLIVREAALDFEKRAHATQQGNSVGRFAMDLNRVMGTKAQHGPEHEALLREWLELTTQMEHSERVFGKACRALEQKIEDLEPKIRAKASAESPS